MSTPNDDDDGGYEKPDLDCIIGASLVDDMGASSVVLERIVKFCRSWHHRRVNDCPLGHSKNLRAIQMACPQTKPEIRMSALSSDR